jgi:hypothetical protein
LIEQEENKERRDQNMGNTFDIIRTTRNNFLKSIEGLSEEQLNLVPTGFNNNIAWNLGHIIVVQQTLCYVRMGFESRISQPDMKRFGKGSKPDQLITKEEIALFKTQVMEQIDQLEKDLQSGFFNDHVYEELSTSYGVVIRNHEDSIYYLATHDALHYGYIQALKRAIATVNN